MAKDAVLVKTRTVYRAGRPQKIQINGALKLVKVGDEVDPTLFTEVLLQRMLVLGMLKKTVEAVKVPTVPAVSTPVETGKTHKET